MRFHMTVLTLCRSSKFLSHVVGHSTFVKAGSTERCRHILVIHRCSHAYGIAKLSPREVSGILRAHESSHEIPITSSVKAFETNQLPSNSPIEDRLAISRCLLTPGMLFGVFDGHGGGDVAELASQCLFDYISLSLLPQSVLKQLSFESNISCKLLEAYSIPMRHTLPPEILDVHYSNLKNFANILLKTSHCKADMRQTLSHAFIQFDNDISRLAESSYLTPALSLAVSGSCACVAHIDGVHLHLANCGDCQAVMGIQSDHNKWTFTPLASIHDADNVEELKRVMSEHPKSEINTVIKNQRLLGQLAPLRAFGDFQYKWNPSLMQKLLLPAFGSGVVPPNYYTPPYLTAKPEVVHYRLTPRDKFLVIASDGLWETLLPHKVIKFVAEHISGKQTLDHLHLPRKQMLLEEVNDILSHRRIGLSKKITDNNVATHLLRNALGRTEYGIEHSKLSAMLSFPEEMVRNFRDDISIIVIFFNTEFLQA